MEEETLVTFCLCFFFFFGVGGEGLWWVGWARDGGVRIKNI